MSTTTQLMSTTTYNHDNTVTIEIAGLEVTLPVKFTSGHMLTESQAKVLDAAYQRQFTNNQNASAKARTEAIAAGKTDVKYQPLSASAIAALYTDYEPSVGGTRMGSMEKIRNDATWRMWTARIKSHNDNVAKGTGDGYEPVIAKAGKAMIPGLKPKRDTNGKVTVTVQEQRDSLIARLLTLPDYADAIQEQVDMILAEKGEDKSTATADNKAEMGELI